MAVEQSSSLFGVSRHSAKQHRNIHIAHLRARLQVYSRLQLKDDIHNRYGPKDD